jgi:hypothetical protein
LLLNSLSDPPFAANGLAAIGMIAGTFDSFVQMSKIVIQSFEGISKYRI